MKELAFWERALIGFISVLIVSFWIWTLLWWPSERSEFSKTVVLVVVAITVAVLCALWYLMIEDHAYKKRRAALEHVLRKTQKVYFYGYPVADCLRSNVAGELHRRRIGDFNRALGLTVLCALKDDKKDAMLYTRWLEDDSGRPGHYDAIICFHHGGNNWRFDLDQPLNSERRLTRYVYGGKSSLIAAGYRSLYFWIMPAEKRLRIGKCSDPDRSFFPPDANYTNLGRSEYENLVQNNVNHAIRVWRWHESENFQSERIPQHVAV
ncbi:MAG: hypothetical protein Q4F56_02095 [Candidatus Saccharibacteria bacterium]|nr:hypothetical protein [Candidatus Saccharibacteria bacterium]